MKPFSDKTRTEGMRMGTTLCALSLFIASSLASVAAVRAESPTPKVPIGMNLNRINDWDTGYPFKNLMWGSRMWFTRPLSDASAFTSEFCNQIPLDKDGYPLEVPFQPEGGGEPQVVCTILPNTTEPGTYVVLYDGEGEIGGLHYTKVVDSAPGRTVLEMTNRSVNPEGVEGLTIKSSTKGNHVRNIRVLREEDESADLAANPFREDFLAYCKQWHALRYMDWMKTVGSLDKEWGGRKHPTFYTMIGSEGDGAGYTGTPASEFLRRFSGGVSLEVMIQLANMTKTSPWFCMPHRATPEYMTEFAKLVKEKLDPSLKVYVEYSNELWNWAYEEAQWMLRSKVAADDVVASGLSAPWKEGEAPDFPFDDGTVSKEEGCDHPERIGALTRRCFKQWENVFTGADRTRLVRVIAVQHAWLDASQRTVKYVMENGGGDAVSSAGYIGGDSAAYERWEAAGANLTADQVIADMNEAFEKDSEKWTRGIAGIASEYNLAFNVYEGGQHLVTKDQKETAYMPALKAAQFTKGMYDIYMRNFALHQEVGCNLFMAYNSFGKQGSRWGSWGHQEFIGQPRTEIPKYGALLDANTPKKP